MFLQHQGQPPKPPDRPHIVRSSKSEQCHPSQIKRALLGDTRGAVFLPSRECSALETPSDTLARPFFRRYLPRTASEISCPPLFHGSVPSLDQICDQRPASSQAPGLRAEPDSSLPQGSCEAALFMDGGVSRSTTNDSQTHNVDQLYDRAGEDIEEINTSGTSPDDVHGETTKLGALNMALPSMRGAGTDGAKDYPGLRRSSSFSAFDIQPDSPKGRPVVRFASRHDLRHRLECHRLGSREVRHHVHQVTPTSTFRNPFGENDDRESRKNSESSSLSDLEYLRPDAFAGHRDTLARIQGPQPRAISEADEASSWPTPIFSGTPKVALGSWDTFAQIHFERRVFPYVSSAIIDRLIHFLHHQEYLNLRLTCRQWKSALPPPKMPGAYRIPREVLTMVLSYLAPCDFDAARHTCRKWFDAGMDLYLLRSVLRGLQCQHGFRSDVRRRNQSAGQIDGLPHAQRSRRSSLFRPLHKSSVSEEWLMSKRVATATRLSVEWRGPWSRRSISQGDTRFSVAEQVNFRRILFGAGPLETTDDKRTFSVSTCGRYLLVLSGCDVFVYDLFDLSDSMTAVIRLVADGNVVRVSMDTSSGRFAVAALLENHTGILWNLAETPGQPGSHSGEPMNLGLQTEVHDSRIGSQQPALAAHLPLRRSEFGAEVTMGFYKATMIAAEREELATTGSPQLLEPILDTSICATPESMTDELETSTGIEIRTRPSAVYDNLGGPDDAPRSLVICPSRKCVAFGSRLGIELHWEDALTGGDLNRWFPLAAPSDHLYFLPQRVGIDSNRKLRLISSAAGPSTPSVSRRESLPARFLQRARTHDRARRKSLTRLFFGSLPFPSAAIFPNGWRNDNIPSDEDRQGVLRTVDCDHYRAIPLSDGFHMLYTDPINGLLCLGSDAPLGGPTKLIRKAVFVPPTVGDDGWAGLMSCYSAGSDLGWGVRIVAAHRDGRLVLYNVPADLFSFIRHQRSSHDVWDENAGVLAQSDLLMDDILTADRNTLTIYNAADRIESGTTMRTIQIEGVQIEHVGRDIVDDVAVDTSAGGVRVWVFCRSGIARLLDIYVDLDHQVRYRFVGPDGLLYESENPSEPTEGHRSPKGKERAHSEDEGEHLNPRFRQMAYDGTADEPDESVTRAEDRPLPLRCSDCGKEQNSSPDRLHVEIIASAGPRMEVGEDLFEVEILTDWRDECLLAPYIVLLE